jgi:hypothetical protein
MKIQLAAAALAISAMALTGPMASASTPHPTVTPATVYCNYQVNAYGVNVRSAPSTSATIVKQVSYPTTGTATQNTYAGSGYYWRAGFGGYVATQYLTKLAGNCLT